MGYGKESDGTINGYTPSRKMNMKRKKPMRIRRNLRAKDYNDPYGNEIENASSVSSSSSSSSEDITKGKSGEYDPLGMKRNKKSRNRLSLKPRRIRRKFNKITQQWEEQESSNSDSDVLES